MNRGALNNSILIHLAIIILLFLATQLDKHKVIEKFEFSLIEKEVIQVKIRPKIIINAIKIKANEVATNKSVREVFGIKRKAIISHSETILVKKGNTITKKEDDKTLSIDDVDDLPAPAEEFLITSMPRAIKEFRPDYPRWAKEKGITGSVIFYILIDEKGKVRQAKLIKNLHPELDQLAKQAIYRVEFKPAYIENEPVAVRIKYAIRYVLEN